MGYYPIVEFKKVLIQPEYGIFAYNVTASDFENNFVSEN